MNILLQITVDVKLPCMLAFDPPLSLPLRFNTCLKFQHSSAANKKEKTKQNKNTADRHFKSSRFINIQYNHIICWLLTSG